MPQSYRSIAVTLVTGALFSTMSATTFAQQTKPQRSSMPQNLFDPRLSELRVASVAWANRQGKPRQVVDAVCLVPDMATFLEVIGEWDADHFFPVLIDDATYTLKFLRAFRPARVIRCPKKPAPVKPDDLWQTATSAVGRSWSGGGDPAARGDQKPPRREPATPGAVIASIHSPTFAAGVALAAGRFQPLLRWEPTRGFKDHLSDADAATMALEIERVVSEVFPQHARLGDDCDFVTMACDYPYAYDSPNPPEAGRASFDDRIGFVPRTCRRWAYSGRLLGDPVSAVYRAMCSLFLQPDSVLLVDTYDDDGDFPLYTILPARRRLASLFNIKVISGPEAGIDGWRRAFTPENRHELLLINSSGSPDSFRVKGGIAGLGDIPGGVPSIVHMIQSHAAHDPTDTKTIAARWLEGGAFLFFGAMNEPYLNSFRTPTLLAELIAEGIPLSAAFRESPAEQFGCPWRLVLLGDPLYRVIPKNQRPGRVEWPAIAQWPAYAPAPAPADTDGDTARLAWALKDAIVTACRKRNDLAVDPAVLLSIERDALPPARRPLYDDLLADALPHARQPGVIRARLEAIPAQERSPSAQRMLEQPVSAARGRPAR